jgi:hypothetical protein
MNKLYVLLLIVFIVLIFKYTRTEGFKEAEKNAAIERIDELSSSMDNDYKIFQTETMNMAKKQQSLFIILGISTFIIVGVTFIYVKNK